MTMNMYIPNLPPAFIGGTGPGGFELLIFFSAILMLFGAKRIPEFARTAGRLMEELRKASTDLKSQLMEAGDEIRKDLPDFSKELSDETFSRDSFHDDIEGGDPHHDDYHDGHHDDEHMDDYARDPYYQSDYSGGDYDPYAVKEDAVGDAVKEELAGEASPEVSAASAEPPAAAGEGPSEGSSSEANPDKP